MNIAVIGSGAREHVMIWKLSLHPGVRLFCYGPNRNPGIAALCVEVGIGEVTDVTAVMEWCRERKVEIAWIGPEAPLAAGVVNALEAFGIACIGPTQAMARLESSKSFTRQLLDKYEISASPIYKVFTTMDGIEDCILSLNDAVVIKPDGLTGGKGVRIMGEQLKTRQDGVQYCQELLASGAPRVVIEEKMVGQEFSLMSFSDGNHLVHMPVVQDHKRALNGDQGFNTGGMGSYTDANHSLPFLHANDIAAAQQINEQTIAAIQAECGEEYKGMIYGGFMAVRAGTRLVEYNARFGDPEVMNLLALLETDLVDITTAIVDRSLDQLPVTFAPLASVCKYVVPNGYPEDPVKHQPIDVSAVDQTKVKLFYGSVDNKDGQLLLQGSRAIGVVATGPTITEAEKIVETEIQKITGPVFHRSDIGTATLVGSRVDMLNNIRHA
jgi:phosphoribosylamine--glycine ligase